jgi:hypothetical protein
MLSRIGFSALLRGLAHRRPSRAYLRATPSRQLTTLPSPPSPFPPGLGPPSPLPPSPGPTRAPTHHITLRSHRCRQPRWPFATHRIKRYLVARFRGQVSPLPELASAGAFKEVVTL